MCSAATRDRLVRLQYRAPKFDFIIKIIYNKYTILKEKRYAGLAQLERASPLQGEGRRFDPVILYQTHSWVVVRTFETQSANSGVEVRIKVG